MIGPRLWYQCFVQFRATKYCLLPCKGGELFSKLDFAQAYNQLELVEETKKLLAWSTHKGIFVPNRLPFGPKPVCAIFQRCVEKLLQGLKGVRNFLDDIIVTGPNNEEHMANLREVFVRLRDAGLRLKKSKCEFFKDEVNYLGHIISKHGLRKDPAKIKALADVRNRGVRVSTLLSRYLFAYRNTPHCYTGQTPASLMLGRDPKTRFDFLNKSKANKMRDRQIENYQGSREVLFEAGEICYARDYRNPNKPCWKKALVHSRLGDRRYLCVPVQEKHLKWKRHVNQMIKVGRFFEDEYNKVREVEPVKEPYAVAKPIFVPPTQEHVLQDPVVDVVRKPIEVETEPPVQSQRVVLPESSNGPGDKVVVPSPVWERSIAVDRPRRQTKVPDRLKL